MIFQIEAADPRLAQAPGEPLLLAMIQGLAKTAGPGLRREVWLAAEEGGCPAVAVCRTEGGVWATAAPGATEETAALLAALGELPATVDGGLAALLPGRGWARRLVLAYRGPWPVEEPRLCVPSCMELAD